MLEFSCDPVIIRIPDTIDFRYIIKFLEGDIASIVSNPQNSLQE
jgi:hypothetical protein